MRSVLAGHSRDLASFGLQNGLWVEEGVVAASAVSLPVQNEFMLSDLLALGLLNGYKDDLFMEYLDVRCRSLLTLASLADTTGCATSKTLSEIL